MHHLPPHSAPLTGQVKPRVTGSPMPLPNRASRARPPPVPCLREPSALEPSLASHPRSEPPRPAARLVRAAVITGILWGAVFPGLAVAGAGDAMGIIVFVFIGATIAMWGSALLGLMNRTPQAAGSQEPVAEAKRAVDALAQLQQRLDQSGDLPPAVQQDVQRAVEELRAETTVLSELVAACDRESMRLGRPDALSERRVEAVQRLTDIGSAADDFSRQIDRPDPTSAHADSLDRLQAARRAFNAASREVR